VLSTASTSAGLLATVAHKLLAEQESRNEASFNTVRATERRVARQLKAASKELEIMREQKKVLVGNATKVKRAEQDIANKVKRTGVSEAQESLVNLL